MPVTVPPFVDAHHHLWDLQACRYPWLMARGVKRFFGDPTPIQRNYLVNDLLVDAEGLPLQASVHVQVGVAPGDELAETAWLQDQADGGGQGFPHAIVASVDLTSDRLDTQLDQQQAFRNVRGIRQIVGRAPGEDALTGSGKLLKDPRWREGLAVLAARDLSFDLQVVPAQLKPVAELLARVPGLAVALCHAGSPWERDASGFVRWQQGIRAIAAVPGVCCKLSGLGMFDPQWSAASARPVFEHVLEVFGAERVMLGSNFPVDRLYGSYRRVWEAWAQLAEPLDTAAREALFSGTARRFYRLDQSD